MIKDSQWLVLKDFLDRKEERTKKTILALLPRKIVTLIESLPHTDPLFHEFSILKFLETVHSSWFRKSFSFLSRNEASLFYFIVPPSHRSIFKSILKEEFTPTEINALSRDYLAKELLRRILHYKKNILPLSYLPIDSANPILTLSASEFDQWLSLLCAYDLAEEINLIIDKKKVESLQLIISPLQARFIKHLKSKKERNIFPPLGLATWNGDVRALEKIFQKRKMQRIGAALSLSDDSFITYFSLRLSIEEAEELRNYLQPSLSPKIVEKAKEQLLKTLAFINPHASTSL